MARTNIQLYDIADVNIVTPATGEVIAYDGVDWVNQVPAPTNKIVQRDSELSINDVDGTPSNLVLKFDNTQVMIANDQQAIFSTNNDIWISYAF